MRTATEYKIVVTGLIGVHSTMHLRKGGGRPAVIEGWQQSTQDTISCNKLN